jgi:hypothetical protein
MNKINPISIRFSPEFEKQLQPTFTLLNCHFPNTVKTYIFEIIGIFN